MASESKGESSGGEDEEEDDDSSSYENLEGAYDPKNYDTLVVPGEVKELFQYLGRYRPHEVELVTTLKCFIPEYIPAIGEIDAFIKVCESSLSQRCTIMVIVGSPT